MTKLAELYQIEDFIDTFALGHYARVFEAVDQRSKKTVAFKVMRSEHLSQDGEIRWEYRAFSSESDLLTRLSESPHVVRLLDCGYISSNDEAPADGDIETFGLDIRQFAQATSDFAERGWRPYLSLENLPRVQNLLYLMKPSRPDVRWRLPSEEGLALALQFAHLLQVAHRKNIVYMDHKLEHVYWDGALLRLIDLNSSRHVEGVGAEQYFRMDIHNLCVGILYPIFTGLSPQKNSLRPQPGNLAEVETRYQDVTTLDFGIEPTLSEGLKVLLQRGAEMKIETVEEFITGLQAVASSHGWDFPDTTTTPDSRTARDHMRAGLRKLRDGQDSIRAARDLFREAAIMDGITEDLENELRRLVKAVNEMLNDRVIP